jgi:hypothetical protein
MTFETTDDVAAGLRRAGYATDPVLVQTIWLASKMRKPILVEGPPGTGKTYLAQACAAAAETDLIRLQCFEGSQKGGDRSFDEAPQRLFLEIRCAVDRHWKRFGPASHADFIQGPLLQGCSTDRGPADRRADKVDQKFEALPWRSYPIGRFLPKLDGDREVDPVRGDDLELRRFGATAPESL